MSSEQQERQAFSYLERTSLLTIRGLMRLLEWSARQAQRQETAYKIGSQTLAELVKTPFSIDTIQVTSDLLDKPIDLEKLKELLNREDLPLALAWQEDYLYFYTKDRSLLGQHLDKLMKELTSDPEKLKGLVSNKTLDEEIALAKTQVPLVEPSAVKLKEVELP